MHHCRVFQPGRPALAFGVRNRSPNRVFPRPIVRRNAPEGRICAPDRLASQPSTHIVRVRARMPQGGRFGRCIGVITVLSAGRTPVRSAVCTHTPCLGYWRSTTDKELLGVAAGDHSLTIQSAPGTRPDRLRPLGRGASSASDSAAAARTRPPRRGFLRFAVAETSVSLKAVSAGAQAVPGPGCSFLTRNGEVLRSICGPAGPAPAQRPRSPRPS